VHARQRRNDQPIGGFISVVGEAAPSLAKLAWRIMRYGFGRAGAASPEAPLQWIKSMRFRPANIGVIIVAMAPRLASALLSKTRAKSPPAVTARDFPHATSRFSRLSSDSAEAKCADPTGVGLNPCRAAFCSFAEV
jgi:hypothetical protein